jgi:hypothetical protein
MSDLRIVTQELEAIQAELDDLSRLVDWWFEEAWPAGLKRCTHKHATMVQAEGKLGWHVTWQCDDCGSPLNERIVTIEDIEAGRTLPHFDVSLWRAGVDRLEQRQLTTMAFFGQAVRRG